MSRDEPKRNTSTSIAGETAQSPTTVRQKRRIMNEALKKAKERGADAPDASDIAAARESLNQKRQKKKPPETEPAVDRRPERHTHITIVSLRSFASKFCENSMDEGASEIVADFLHFVEREIEGVQPHETDIEAPLLSEILGHYRTQLGDD